VLSLDIICRSSKEREESVYRGAKSLVMRRVATQKRPTSEYDYLYRIKIQIVWPGLGLAHSAVKVKLSHTCGLRAFRHSTDEAGHGASPG
jgi:hypothetical protein